MVELADSATVYTTKWLKRKIIEKYDQHVFFAEMKGRSDMVCLKNFADLIVNNAWYEMREKDLKKESERIINTAAKLILSGVRSINLESDIYPLENEIADINICESLLPESLTHMHGLAVYVKEGLPFARDLSLENSADSYLCF